MKRIIAATFNSLAGLKHGFRHEAAIRQEIILLFMAVPLALLLTFDPWRLLALWGSLLIVLMAELLNTGVEQVANKITRDYADEIRFAKDCGSAAVMCALAIAGAVWGIVLLERLAIL